MKGTVQWIITVLPGCYPVQRPPRPPASPWQPNGTVGSIPPPHPKGLSEVPSQVRDLSGTFDGT